ncbi:transmembrane protein 126A-like [Portunus trituberculatus]|uniref:transmembrane protein 126A-like n=1 Tax=Portunus trituberculatus TaxID=210409 RepID=UPI001E1CF977|nr:transmembrane protein 126A-like [Portunus trituberculatus]
MADSQKQSNNEKESTSTALTEAIDLIMNWKPTSDVFALKHFMVASAFLSTCSATYINAHYRKVVKLRNQAFMTTLLPVIIAPSLLGGMFHHQFVHRPLILETFKCPVCVEIRGGMVQLFTGFVYPLMLAPLAAMQFAARLYTYPVPDAKKPLLMLMEIYKITKPVLPRLYILAALQFIGGVAWTHWELHNLYTVLGKLNKMEEALKDHPSGVHVEVMPQQEHE